MDEHVLIGLVSIITLGIAAQWIAWRVKLPSILVLLLVGFVAGPVTGFLEPDILLDDLLSPIVSISVALILFEGGLSLKIDELRKIRGVVRNLITLGVVLTWLLSTGAAHLLLGLDLSLSLLLGSILVVTGPTVILPLLRDIRPTGRVSKTLRWEGILIDPVGVTLAVLVFEGIFIADVQQATAVALLGFVETLLVGGVIGLFSAGFLTLMLRRYWIPDFLQVPITVMLVVGAFAVSDLLQPESGLLTVTLMGIVMANQKAATVKHIVEFKENLGVMLISGLFILLSARLHLDDLAHVGLETVVFVAFLILMVRPLSVFIATLRSGWSWQERLFVAWLAPRGIVAAASASLFALELIHVGHPQAELLTPITFTVIVATVSIYGLTARSLAYRLGVAEANPQGVLIVGAHRWARSIAHALIGEGYRVLMVDSNWDHIQAAQEAGIPAYCGNILSVEVEELDLSGIGRLLALTSNDEVNSLAALHFSEVFGRSEVYQLSCKPGSGGDAVPPHLRGRLVFGSRSTFEMLRSMVDGGATVRLMPLSAYGSFERFREVYQDQAIPLFLTDETGRLSIVATDSSLVSRPGQVVISLIQSPESRKEVAPARSLSPV